MLYLGYVIVTYYIHEGDSTVSVAKSMTSYNDSAAKASIHV